MPTKSLKPLHIVSMNLSGLVWLTRFFFALDIVISNIEEELTQAFPAPKRIKKDSLVSRKPLRAQRTGTNSQTIELEQ